MNDPIDELPQTTQSVPPPTPDRTLYLGLFLITCSTLLLELGLTRIFTGRRVFVS